ncbi:cytidine/deoxycytidylate deaminase family protein, zinc-binding protein [Gottschalkia acidurici 9a]|uniref:tRNA-specific adenosine deaminase n=1 Tax=Gottschalkia acidurici (strain ATCC 7906 / DSM 604 / BCRC 14475 / CIP 104303 / KCTC 5404 / NCIMB 10678 / 9a) TaxID=1128398 RepID=K0ATC8_GOTA9|nr:tRNA adenosine(34) deaminase TadA [Gottschalkia acidurici]AFS77118.1 cytidine/deoxycytidylate deaminase family protein, zinc-binding protein [Gottschalkia acidurici 9a]
MEEYFMREALNEAYKAERIGEVPVGAVIVKDEKIISRGHNMRETLNDPTAHAEIIAIKRASEVLESWRLIGCTIYVTIEPCSMCAGAIVNSRIEKVAIGALDPKMGACGSVINVVQNKNFNHRVEITKGILETKCSSIMKDFFKKLRYR